MSAANPQLLLIIALATATINIASTALRSGATGNKCELVGHPCDPHVLDSCPTHCDCVDLYFDKNYTCEQKFYPFQEASGASYVKPLIVSKSMLLQRKAWVGRVPCLRQHQRIKTPIFHENSVPPYRRGGTQSRITMSAVNSAVVLIFAITLTMINFSSSQFPHNSGVLQCQSVGQDCSSENDCVGNCTCEELGNGDGTSRRQCAEPPTAVLSPGATAYY
ncbi:hypothetical protein MTO96_051861 [Rhipicephalus appendiculatus]